MILRYLFYFLCGNGLHLSRSHEIVELSGCGLRSRRVKSCGCLDFAGWHETGSRVYRHLVIPEDHINRDRWGIPLAEWRYADSCRGCEPIYGHSPIRSRGTADAVTVTFVIPSHTVYRRPPWASRSLSISRHQAYFVVTCTTSTEGFSVNRLGQY